MALRVGYRLCVEGGARFVVTLDADGQNDPAELPGLLAPLVDDAADFVVASRRLGVDETSDRVRQAGRGFFAWLMNRLTGSTSPTPPTATAPCAPSSWPTSSTDWTRTSTRRPSC